jgi:hypothetical protein
MLFNMVLHTGKIPQAWSIGYISPIYKGKGSLNDPDNYRGITVLSCFGKLFTSVINDRIYSFLDKNSLLGIEQSGFRKGHSTMDHVFALHCLIDVYLQRKRRLFCAFIDYKKAFDSVQHGLLWEKLWSAGVNGKVLNVIRDMYAKAKSCVKTRHGLSQFFVSNVGLRQGENLSPVLFSLFLNDLKGFLTSNNAQGLKLPFALAQDVCLRDIEHYLYLFLMLYADDTVVLAESPEALQRALDILKKYCDAWGLDINVNKTKVMIFSRGKIRKVPTFYFDNKTVDVVWDYKYLGVKFNYNNKFKKAQQLQLSLANRAMFSLLRKCRQLNLPLDIQLELFEKCVHPILLYGCEIWAYENMDVVTKLQLRFLKLLLGVKVSTPTCMVLGELGRYPIELEAKCRILGFWYSLCSASNLESPKISNLMFQLCSKLYYACEYKLPWLKKVHSLLDSLGLSYIWSNQVHSTEQFKRIVKQRLRDQFMQEWESTVTENSVCCNYRIFKNTFCFEEYLIYLPYTLSQRVLKFRLSNHRLPIQQRRALGIPRDERICTICNSGEVGDEFHYLLTCSNETVKQNRIKYVDKYYTHHPNVPKFCSLMNITSKLKMVKLARFISCIMDLF